MQLSILFAFCLNVQSEIKTAILELFRTKQLSTSPGVLSLVTNILISSIIYVIRQFTINSCTKQASGQTQIHHFECDLQTKAFRCIGTYAKVKFVLLERKNEFLTRCLTLMPKIRDLNLRSDRIFLVQSIAQFTKHDGKTHMGLFLVCPSERPINAFRLSPPNCKLAPQYSRDCFW